MERTNIDPNGATSASEYDVNYVRLFTHRSEDPIDITKLVNYIEIFESLYSPVLTINVNITDTQSVANLLPLMGEEFIELDVRGPDGETGIVGQGFSIYKLSDRKQISDKGYTFTLNCISPAAIIDMNLKISQAITGKASDIVETKLCRSSLSISKPIYSHPTKHNITYISNYWSPIQNIKYLCDRAVSADSSAPSYFFYETKKQFNFVPLNSLVSQQANFDYFYTQNMHSADLETQQGIVHKLTVDETFNYIDRIMSGTYGNRTLTVNMLDKRYQYNYYDFIESFNKFNRLNPEAFGTDNAARKLNSTLRVRHYTDKVFDGMPSENNSDWFRQRLTEVSAINSQTVTMEAVGRFNIHVGNVINLIVPITTPSLSEVENKDMSKLIDASVSGRYLVTGIRHMLDRTRHTMSLQLSKDSQMKM